MVPAASTASRPAFVTIAIRPFVGQDGQLVELICPTGKAEYFCAQIWTGRIALIRFNNLAFTRNGPQAAQARSPEKSRHLQRQNRTVAKAHDELEIAPEIWPCHDAA
jgi:hypothetical protein